MDAITVYKIIITTIVVAFVIFAVYRIERNVFGINDAKEYPLKKTTVSHNVDCIFVNDMVETLNKYFELGLFTDARTYLDRIFNIAGLSSEEKLLLVTLLRQEIHDEHVKTETGNNYLRIYLLRADLRYRKI